MPMERLPQQFAHLIAPYTQGKVIYDKADLFKLWQTAIDAQKQHPELRQAIAHWTMSCAASSPLVNENNLLEEIHFTFGELEIEEEEKLADTKWALLERLVAEADKN